MSKSAKSYSLVELVGELIFYNPEAKITIHDNVIVCDRNPVKLEYPKGYGINPNLGCIYSPASADAFKIKGPAINS